jgi:glycosyltransferase involved in cell wall biosynthesis
MRLLQCDLASSYPLGRAGGHRTVHSLLLQLSRDPSVECMTLFPRRGLGSVLPDYDPKLADFEALGIKELHVAPGRWTFDCGYPAWAVDRVEEEFNQCVEAFRPDVVWSNSLLSLPILRDSRRRGLPALWYVHDCRCKPDELREAAKLGVHIVACSNFIRDRLCQTSGVESEVVYPLITEGDYQVERTSERFVTLINPRPVKGYEIFLRLAPLLPDIQFLVVEAWPLGEERAKVEAELAKMSNVRFVRQLADMREVYANTHILLVPSVVEEGGPRVVREAQLNRIPVLGSPRGTVPEMIGGGGRVIEDYENAQSWAIAIRALLDDTRTYQALSDAAFTNAHRDDLTTQAIVDRFKVALRRTIEQ